MQRLKVGVVFGGRSGEHEVSLMSAASIMRTLVQAGYDVVPVGIDKSGQWLLPENSEQALKGLHGDGSEPVTLLPQPGTDGLVKLNGSKSIRQSIAHVDVIFPALHGTYGEDGSIQGLLEMANIPYVGAGVLASSVGMDKDIQKRLFRERGLPVLDFLMVPRFRWEQEPDSVIEQIGQQIGYPCFVKPCNLGSSVGVTKVKDRKGLPEALNEAALYDRKILVEDCAEEFHEIECSVLGNDDPIASAAGEIMPSREFYDYAAKYIDGRSRTEVPARIPPEVEKRVQRLAIESFKAIDCAGMARVDFFVMKRDHSIYINEVNTIPGFTKISMYPKMWEASGLSYPDLLRKLIELAIEHHHDKNRRLTDYKPPIDEGA